MKIWKRNSNKYKIYIIHDLVIIKLYIIVNVNNLLNIADIPETITELRVVRSTSQSVTLSWVLRDNGGSPILYYTVEYSPVKGQ